MNLATPTYRWNTSVAAEAYDAAAPAIHPHYETVQNQILDRLPFSPDESFVVVDLGAGSGQLAERLLARFANARAVLVDQSAPFLALAERRLRGFASRVKFIQRRLQDDWAVELSAAPDVIVSTSAIHHLEPEEKRTLFARCFAALKPGGLFINGDEYRPAGDDAYRTARKLVGPHAFCTRCRPNPGLIPTDDRSLVRPQHPPLRRSQEKRRRLPRDDRHSNRLPARRGV